MASVLLLVNELSLLREWLDDNPDQSVFVYGSGLPREIDGLEGRVLPASLTLKEAKAYGEWENIIDLPAKKAKKPSKKAAEGDE